jgi:Replication initiator protein A
MLSLRLYSKLLTEKAKWRIGVDRLQKKCGFKQARKHLVDHLRDTIKGDHIPDYRFKLDDDFATVYRRAAEAQPPKPAESSPAPARAAPAEHEIRLSSAAIEEGRKYAIAARLDIYWLERTYIEWAKTLDEPARNEDKRFINWVINFTKAKSAS